MPGCSSSSSGSTSRSRPSPPGKSVVATSCEVRLDGGVRLREARCAPSRRARRAASRARSRLASRSARCVESSSSRSFSASYSSFASGLTWPSESRRFSSRSTRSRERVAVVALGGHCVGGLEPAARLRRVGLDPGELDVDGARALRGLRGLAAKLDLLRAERAQRLAELLRAVRARVDPCAQRRLEPRARLDRALERCDGAICEACETGGDDGVEPPRRQRVERGAGLGGRSSASRPRAPRRAPSDASSSSISRRSSRPRASSSSSTASAVSPENHSSPLAGS